MTLKKFTLSLAVLASLSLLVACSTKEQRTSAAQASTSSEVITSQISENQIIIGDMNREVLGRIILKK